MNTLSENEKLTLFKSLFKGREDVFALHHPSKAGGSSKGRYMPAYQLDPFMYNLHRRKGGTFKDFKDKTYLHLTNQQLSKHLKGEQLIGIYPLLPDNTSWFIAADFDKENWAKESKTFISICRDKGIPAYLERSRSGKGGHVWIFFEKPYPAVRSRNIFISLLEQSGIISIFEKRTSFDRLFPNQNFHSGKKLGNLIALPLHKPALEQGNSCFVTNELQPYPDQWSFLSSIQRVAVSQLDAIFESLSTNSAKRPDLANSHSDKLHITLNNAVHLNRSGIPPLLIGFLKKELTFSNSEFFIKQKTGRSTWGVERYFNFIEETEHEVIVPRGFVGRLIRFCQQQKIDFAFQDRRRKLDPVKFATNFSLRKHQETALEAASRKDFGIISAPAASGKTVMGLKIVAEKQQPALIVVHRRQLLNQWIERIEAFLEIPKREIGSIGQGKVKPDKVITVAMVQSLGKYLEKQESDEFINSFGTIIIDECHHIPAKTYRNTLSKFPSRYQYGLTATPFRKGNDDKIIFFHLEEVIADIKPQEIEEYKRARVIVRETSLDVPYNPKTDPFEILSKMLVHDSARNKLILGDITTELNKGKKAVIITERKEHIDVLYQYLKHSFETITLSGEDSESSRTTKWKTLNDGRYQALITTGQFFGEGTDLQNASCLFLVYPFSFKGKLIQYIGRVQRSKITPFIYDYRDRKIEYLNRLFLKRNTWYRHLDRHASLFDDLEISKSPSTGTFTIDKKIKVPIDQLDFLYGAIAFKHTITKTGTELEFEIENDAIRPEFDVLKPYFSKVLKSKQVEIVVFAEFENGLLVSQSATSPHLERINREIIESVKFRFLEKGIIGRQFVSGAGDNLLDINKLQEEQTGKPLYDTEEQLLNDLLKNKNIKHYKQLRYLAGRHEGTILKLRFVLSPFSFVFLLRGAEQYHIILETLDTEEATYIWHTGLPVRHIEKKRPLLKQKLQAIDQDLNLIRNQGRQIFLENPPEHFNRLIHDYSNERKGFIVWKDQLEARLL